MTDRPRDRGFTLVEVLISITILGVLAATVAAAFAVIVRTAPPTDARADDARSLLGISTWLPADVSATPRQPLADPTDHWDDSPVRASGCSGVDPGINVLRLEYRESISGSPRNFYVSYRLVDDTEDSNLVRVSCTDGGPGEVLNVTAGLPPISADPVDVAWKVVNDLGIDYVVGVELELRTFEGDTLRVDAASRNPATTLSTVPDAVTTTSSTTTSTTTTSTTIPNQPPTAGPVGFTANPLVPVTFVLPAMDPEGQPLTAVLTGLPAGWTSSVVGLQVTVTPLANGTYSFGYTVTDPGGLTASSTIDITVNSSSTTTSTLPPNGPPVAGLVAVATDPGVLVEVDLPVSDPNGDPLTVTLDSIPDGWAAQVVTPDASSTAVDVAITPPATASPGPVTIGYTVTDPSGATAGSTIEVTVTRIPCVASFVSMQPNPVRNTASGTGNGNQVGPLVEEVDVTIDKSGNCSELVLRYTRVVSAPGGQASADDRQPQIDVFGDGVTLTFVSSPTERWQKGDRPIELVEFPGLPGEIVHEVRTLVVQ